MSDQPTIYERMSAILAELPAIGKTDFNPQQKFHFRGIDAVLNALNPLLAKHGVFYMPEVLERVENERATKGGSAMYVVNLHVRFRFYGLAGDYVEATAWGEGTDMGDKATNKAMTGAMKYCLFQTFAISTQEGSDADSDREAVPETVSRHAPRPVSDGERACERCGGSLAGVPVKRNPDGPGYIHAKGCEEVSGDGAHVQGFGDEPTVPADDPGRPFEEASA